MDKLIKQIINKFILGNKLILYYFFISFFNG